MSATSAAPLPPVLVSVEDAAGMLSMSRAAVYRLITRGEIVSVSIGRSRRVPVAALHDFADRLLRSGQMSDPSVGL